MKGPIVIEPFVLPDAKTIPPRELKELEHKMIRERNKEALAQVRAIMEAEWSDSALAKLHGELWDAAREAVRREEYGLTIPERAFRTCHFNRGGNYGELPSPRGGTVADHVPPDYRGFEMAKDGHTVPELIENLIPTSASFSEKQAIAAEQHVQAYEALRKHNNPQNQVRLLIAEAQYWILMVWPDRFAGEPPQLKRHELIERIIAVLDWVMPSLMENFQADVTEGAQP